jgi:hypothetical protein
MPSPFTYDTANRLFIVVGSGDVTIDARNAYSWVKHDWLTDDSLNRFAFPIDSIGGQSIGGGVSISAYYSLRYGWRIKPPEADCSITIVGNVITDTGDDPFIGTSGSFDTVIKYVVSGNSLSVQSEEELTADQIWDLTNGVEASLTPREALRLLVAANAGKLSGAATATVRIRDINDTKDRIVANVDESGNRLDVATDAT